MCLDWETELEGIGGNETKCHERKGFFKTSFISSRYLTIFSS